jgi:NAD+ kinase
MKFETIGVITKLESESARQTLQSLCDFLGKKNCTIILDNDCPEIIDNCGFTRAGRDIISQQSDLVIVIGGDGTILNAVRSLAHAEVPLLGINVGRLGFLADISPADLEASLDEILHGFYLEEQRLLLEMQVVRDNKVIFQGDAFNDVVVHIRDIARMIEFETRINDEFVNHQRADGIVVSTPTGSTAYALSSGGPILHATLDVLALVPISPHTLSSRPLVVNADSQINILVCNTRDGIAQATCDGQLSTDVLVGDHIRVKRKHKKIKLLHPRQYNYFEILRAKLHWSEHT